MVMKRYPNGINGEFFFMKRAPSPRPPIIPVCAIEHGSGNVIGFPVIQHLSSLLWVVNLGCIDLNPWYARCDDVRPAGLFAFRSGPGAGRVVRTRAGDGADRARCAGLHQNKKLCEDHRVARDSRVRSHQRGPTQKEVWAFAKALAKELETRHPKIITAEYRVAKRPRGRVLVDYNQNAWNRTLASVYSVRPKPAATVSAPVTWGEVERGVRIEDFTVKNVPARLKKIGDLWKPLLAKTGRVNLKQFLVN